MSAPAPAVNAAGYVVLGGATGIGSVMRVAVAHIVFIGVRGHDVIVRCTSGDVIVTCASAEEAQDYVVKIMNVVADWEERPHNRYNLRKRLG